MDDHVCHGIHTCDPGIRGGPISANARFIRIAPVGLNRFTVQIGRPLYVLQRYQSIIRWLGRTVTMLYILCYMCGEPHSTPWLSYGAPIHSITKPCFCTSYGSLGTSLYADLLYV